MPRVPTQKEIGKRIMELRKARGLSQGQLANDLSIPRSSLAQIELGNRYVDVMELHKLSLLLQFSLDDFFAADFKLLNQEKVIEPKEKKRKQEERISVAELNVSKFKNILLYILEKCAGKPNVGETVLYKLLYFSDFNYYELYEEHLSGARYRKLPYGPVPRKFDSIIESMINKGEIKKFRAEYYGKTQTRYIPLKNADLKELKASEKDIIDKVIEQMSDWSAATVSFYSHNDMPWKASKDGEEINYELAFYRTPPYSVRSYNEDEQ